MDQKKNKNKERLRDSITLVHLLEFRVKKTKNKNKTAAFISGQMASALGVGALPAPGEGFLHGWWQGP